MEKLIELANASVSVIVYGYRGYSGKNWDVTLEKETPEVNLKIKTTGLDLLTVINEAYDKWVLATIKIPTHSLQQIEYTKSETSPDETF